MELIDFTQCKKRNKAYAGANGNKISIIFNGDQYMLKFPSMAKKNPNLSYSNSCFSEYLGSQIYNIIGVPAQETLLGTYNVNGKQKIVVACKDFTSPGIVLQDFASMKNQIIDSERNGYGTELSDILQTIASQTAMDQVTLEERFWDMFIIDTFLGNWDRHNGNWGFLYDTVTDQIELSPVYDCGSSLYPQADDAIMQAILTDKDKRDKRIFDTPTSAIVINNKRIRYFDFMSSLEYPGCNQALKRIVPKINIKQIHALIDETPGLTHLQRQFYSTMLGERKSRILDVSLEKLIQKETQTSQQNTRTNHNQATQTILEAKAREEQRRKLAREAQCSASSDLSDIQQALDHPGLPIFGNANKMKQDKDGPDYT